MVPREAVAVVAVAAGSEVEAAEWAVVEEDASQTEEVRNLVVYLIQSSTFDFLTW